MIVINDMKGDYTKILGGFLFALILILSFSFISLASAQEVVYLSNNCDGLSSCYSNLSEAISFVSDNGKIIIKNGEYSVDLIKIEKSINIDGEDKGKTIFHPSMETSCCTGDSQAWFLISPGVDFHVSGLTFDGGGKKISQAIRSFGNGKISNNIFRNISWSDNQGAAIVVFGGNTIIDSNYFSGIGRNSIWAGSYYSKQDSGISIPFIGNNYQITNNILEGKGECDCIDYGIEIGVKTSNTKISGNEIFNYLGRYSAESSYSMGIFVWNIFGETLNMNILNNSLHNCLIPIFLKNQGDANNQIIIKGNNMHDNEYLGLDLNYNQNSVINFEKLPTSESQSSEGGKISAKPDYLFDIKLDIPKKNIGEFESLVANLRFENFGTKSTPTHLNYIILGEDNKEIYSESEDIVVETEQIVTKKFDNLNLSEGKYILHVQVGYSDVTDEFKQEFFVEHKISKLGIYWWIVLILILVIWVLIKFYVRYLRNLKKNKNRNFRGKKNEGLS